MLQDLELQTITLSDAAAKAIRDIVEERKLEGYALRVYMAGSGCCSGVSFGMALDNNIREVDRTFDSCGVRVVVDQVSMDYLNGAKIDFVNDLQRGAGFVVDSPSAHSHEHAHDEGGCACGGSCDCKN
ncbi:MAG TPA: iron-sulfur cluster assembly accessory protein [Anaerolineales bacterium]|nr:iron-sulfur cluster assembly accessory protein [Anaerolineales bacterium]